MRIKKTKFAVVTALLFYALVYAVVKFRNLGTHPADSGTSATASSLRSENSQAAKSPNTTSNPLKSPSQAFSPRPLSSADLSLTEIFANDDVCALEKYIMRKRDGDVQTYQAEAEAAYFASSPFSASYSEYTLAMSGMPAGNSNHAKFLMALRMANWIEGGPRYNGKADVLRASEDLAQLAVEDSGNAAPAVFALAMAKSIGKPIDDLIALVRSSNRFDSYQLNYLRAMADFDDPSTTSFLMRISHHATLAIPNWGNFKTEFLRATDQDLELRYFVTDLMMKEAKETKQPSVELGFNVLQTAMARAIAGGGRSYPNFKEIDSAFPQTHREDPAKFVGLLADTANNECDPARVEKLRAYVHELHARNSRGGLAF